VVSPRACVRGRIGKLRCIASLMLAAMPAAAAAVAAAAAARDGAEASGDEDARAARAVLSLGVAAGAVLLLLLLALSLLVCALPALERWRAERAARGQLRLHQLQPLLPRTDPPRGRHAAGPSQPGGRPRSQRPPSPRYGSVSSDQE
jgi:hypothetical protein